MRALITGATGQDGLHLTKLLLSKNYKVFALVRDLKSPTTTGFHERYPMVELISGQLTNSNSLRSAIIFSSPTEIYNFEAISHVGKSDLDVKETALTNALGPIGLFEVIRTLGLSESVKIYQASSSEIFGNPLEAPQNELTHLNPVSPYGIAKGFAHQTARFYRDNYGMYIAIGILYNHEGEFRRHEYVTRKITSSLAKIKLGKIENFSLGDVSSERDWGYAGDYVEAIWKMMQRKYPSEYVIATGITHTVRDFLIEAIKVAGLPSDYSNYVKFDTSLIRPLADRNLVGDSSKAQEELSWRPKVDFDELVKIMVLNDIAIENTI